MYSPISAVLIKWLSSSVPKFSEYIIMTINTKYSSYEPRHDKTNKISLCPAKTQISLGICPVWSESSVCTQWVAKDRSFFHQSLSDQSSLSARAILLVLSWGGSNYIEGLEIAFSFILQNEFHSIFSSIFHSAWQNLYFCNWIKTSSVCNFDIAWIKCVRFGKEKLKMFP